MQNNCTETTNEFIFWLFITICTGILGIILLVVFFKIFYLGLVKTFLSLCCNEGYDLAKISKSIIWVIVFNIVFSLNIFLSVYLQESNH